MRFLPVPRPSPPAQNGAVASFPVFSSVRALDWPDEDVDLLPGSGASAAARSGGKVERGGRVWRPPLAVCVINKVVNTAEASVHGRSRFSHHGAILGN